MTIQQRSARIPPDAIQPSPQDPATSPTKESDEVSFEDHLEAAREQTEDIELSAHAKQRIAERNISLNPTERQTLARTMDHLDDKGAQDAAVLRDDAAFVVNVPNRTVITALGRSEMQQRVFTQIDSAVML